MQQAPTSGVHGTAAYGFADIETPLAHIDRAPVARRPGLS